jgi:outer membrane receptor protein involved in Fe transport
MSDLIKRKTFIDFSSNPPFYKKSVNQGEFRFWGVEYEGKYSLHKNILLTANASYQKSTEKEALEDDKDAENGALHPNLMVKIGVLYHFNRWNFGVFNNYISAGYSPSAVNPHTWEINNEPKAVSLLSAKICYELPLNKSKLKFTGQLFNLLNQEFNYTDFPNKKLNTYVPLEKGFRYNFSVAIDF